MTNQYYWALTDDEYIAHHGILGQKWGIRRYQNADGTLTEEGKKHVYGGAFESSYNRRKRADKAVSYGKKLTSAEKKLDRAIEKGDEETINKRQQTVDYLRNTKKLYMKDLTQDELDMAEKRIQNTKAWAAGFLIGGPVGALAAEVGMAAFNKSFQTQKRIDDMNSDRLKKYKDSIKPKDTDDGTGDKRAQEVVKQWESEKKSSSTEKKGMSPKTINDKVAYAKKTGKFDMEFLEQNGDMDPTASRYLEGKELENAYKQWLQKTYG